MGNLDMELVRHALSVARQHGFAEVEIGVGEHSFSAKLDAISKPKPSAKASPTEIVTEQPLANIHSTLVGYYREAKNPLRVGSTVKNGDVVAVVAALGIASDIESKVSGEVVELLVEPNQPLEYGQVIAKVKL